MKLLFFFSMIFFLCQNADAVNCNVVFTNKRTVTAKLIHRDHEFITLNITNKNGMSAKETHAISTIKNISIADSDLPNYKRYATLISNPTNFQKAFDRLYSRHEVSEGIPGNIVFEILFEKYKILETNAYFSEAFVGYCSITGKTSNILKNEIYFGAAACSLYLTNYQMCLTLLNELDQNFIFKNQMNIQKIKTLALFNLAEYYQAFELATQLINNYIFEEKEYLENIELVAKCLQKLNCETEYKKFSKRHNLTELSN